MKIIRKIVVNIELSVIELKALEVELDDIEIYQRNTMLTEKILKSIIYQEQEQ